MTTITCARPGCGVTKAVRKKGQRYCSHRCDLLVRGVEKLRATGQRGGEQSGKVRWHRALATWRTKYPQIPAALARSIYLQGYNSGHQAGRQQRSA